VKVVYKNNDLLVIEKPSGIVVNRSKTTIGLKTIQDQIINSNLIEFGSGEYEERSGLIHRLDKDTSGLLMIARNQKAYEYFKRKLKNRQIKKHYLALVWGELPKKGIINFPLSKMFSSRGMPIRIDSKGKDALTLYKLKSLYKFGNNYISLVDIEIKTGRTHQIRAHMYYLGFPLFGDKIYTRNKKDEKRIFRYPRLFLHAYKLVVPMPKSKKSEFRHNKLIKLDLPDELKLTLKKIKEYGYQEIKKK